MFQDRGSQYSSSSIPDDLLGSRSPGLWKSSDPRVETRVDCYLQLTEQKYLKGQAEYYVRSALKQALRALKEGNYGIGALAVLVKNGQVYEFPGRNAMVTGLGVSDHAEARALTDAGRFLRMHSELPLSGEEAIRSALVNPALSYPKSLNKETERLADGLHVFGTLEPCPMCATMIMNAGAASSISGALDGNLVFQDGRMLSDGAAMAIGEKRNLLPAVWQYIQNTQQLEFAQLETADTDLIALCAAVFLETREQIDSKLAQRRLNQQSSRSCPEEHTNKAINE